MFTYGNGYTAANGEPSSVRSTARAGDAAAHQNSSDWNPYAHSSRVTADALEGTVAFAVIVGEDGLTNCSDQSGITRDGSLGRGAPEGAG